MTEQKPSFHAITRHLTVFLPISLYIFNLKCHWPCYLNCLTSFDPFRAAHSTFVLTFRFPFSLPSSTSTVWVIIRKAADSDRNVSEKQKKNKSPPPLRVLPVLLANGDSDDGVGGVALAVSHPEDQRWVGLLSPGDILLLIRFISASLLHHPLGPWRPYGYRTLQNMFVPVCHSVKQPEQAFALKPLPSSSYRFPRCEQTRNKNTMFL